MKIALTIFLALFVNSTAKAQEIICQVSKSKNSVSIQMQVPHSNNALIHRPDGETVWLQTSPEYLHKQMENFSTQKIWTIDNNSIGTVFVNGRASIQKIFTSNGQYHLLIADNLETELQETKHVSCYFNIELPTFK